VYIFYYNSGPEKQKCVSPIVLAVIELIDISFFLDQYVTHCLLILDPSTLDSIWTDNYFYVKELLSLREVMYYLK